MDINQILKEINNPRLKSALSKASQSKEGNELIKSLKSADKTQIMGLLKNINADKVPTEDIIKQLENNPDIINKVNSILKGK